MIVVDASAILAILINAPTAAILRRRMFAQGHKLHAPHLIDIEVVRVIRRWFLTGEMQLDRAQEAIALFQLMPIERYSHEILLDRIWQHRANLTAYDAAYVALAETLDTIVLTVDAKLASVPGLSSRVVLVV
jgi:predicted nucleic acid-binding protein